jgi:hypothetical protein
MGRYMTRKNEKKIMYVANINPPLPDDTSAYNFFHNSHDDHVAPDAAKQHLSVNRLNYEGLEPGRKYKVEVSTIYDGQEVAETFLNFSTRPGPPTDLKCDWGFEIGDHNMRFKASLKWSGSGAEGETYVTQIQEGDRLKTHDALSEPSLEYIAHSADEKIGVRIWNVTADNLNSEEGLEEVLPPVPTLMSGYMEKLRGNTREENAGSKYMYQVKNTSLRPLPI